MEGCDPTVKTDSSNSIKVIVTPRNVPAMGRKNSRGQCGNSTLSRWASTTTRPTTTTTTTLILSQGRVNGTIWKRSDLKRYLSSSWRRSCRSSHDPYSSQSLRQDASIIKDSVQRSKHSQRWSAPPHHTHIYIYTYMPQQSRTLVGSNT